MDFNKIIKNNKHNIKNIIRAVTKEDNEDLEQEVYFKIWRNSEKYEEKGSIKSWISAITKNTALDYLKSSYYKVFRVAQTDDESLSNIKDKKITPETNTINLERQKRIINAINHLKPKFRQAVMLCEIEGYTYEQCAKKLKCPTGTVKSRIFNAKKELAKELEDLL